MGFSSLNRGALKINRHDDIALAEWFATKPARTDNNIDGNTDHARTLTDQQTVCGAHVNIFSYRWSEAEPVDKMPPLSQACETRVTDLQPG